MAAPGHCHKAPTPHGTPGQATPPLTARPGQPALSAGEHGAATGTLCGTYGGGRCGERGAVHGPGYAHYTGRDECIYGVPLRAIMAVLTHLAVMAVMAHLAVMALKLYNISPFSQNRARTGPEQGQDSARTGPGTAIMPT